MPRLPHGTTLVVVAVGAVVVTFHLLLVAVVSCWLHAAVSYHMSILAIAVTPSNGDLVVCRHELVSCREGTFSNSQAESFTSLLFGRAAVGAAVGGLIPTSFAVIGDMCPAEAT